jgi:hypothetical protein
MPRLDFDRLAGATQTAQELYGKMLELYPSRINPKDYNRHYALGG